MNAMNMIDISFTFQKHDGKWDNELVEKTMSIPINCRVLNLRMQHILEIDLAQLVALTKLEKLYLGFNLIRSINFAPLAELKHLKVIDIGTIRESKYTANNISSIDLEPLRDCNSLTVLNLSGNSLKSCDISPLIDCDNLQSLDLSRNVIKEIDMSPLDGHQRLERIFISNCKLKSIILPALPSLKKLHLHGNYFDALDLTPLKVSKNLEELRILPNTLKSLDISPLKSCKNLNLSIERVHIQQLMLSYLGIPEYHGFDGDLLELLHQCQDDNLNDLQNQLLLAVHRQIANNGPTLFFNLRKIANNCQNALIPLIVRRRKQEVEDTVILIQNGIVDLRPLFLTEYGFRILTSLGMDLFCKEEQLLQIKQAFNYLGIEFGTTRIPDARNCSVWASDSMREYVFAQAIKYRKCESQLTLN